MVVFVLASAVIAPVFFLGNASGHDLQFHLASWMDVSGQWREGILFPRWAEWANWGFGEPRFIFYPPVSWTLGAFLGVLLPWKMVPGAYDWLALVVAGFSMWKFAREWLPEPQAIAAAALYMLNPYHLVIVYYRSDFAELLAGALLPLLLCCALGVTREGGRRVPLLALIFAVIWVTNAPEAVISTYSLSLIVIVACAMRRSLRPVVTGTASMCGGFGLAAFYILPAAYERRWVRIGQAISDNLRPDMNFLFTHANDPDFMRFNWKVSLVALVLILFTAIAAALAFGRRRHFPEPWWILFVLSLASIALMLRLSLVLWRLLPNLAFVQFPWRWLEVLSLGFAFFTAAAWSPWPPSRRPWLASLAMVASFAVIAAAGALMVKDAWWDTQDAPVVLAAIRSGQGYEGTDEYQPNGDDRTELPGNPDPTTRADDASATPAQPVEQLDADSGEIIPATGVRVDRWTAERKSFTSNSSAPVTLALKLLSYPAWQAQVDGRKVHFDVQSATARLLLPLPTGTHHVEIGFRRTWDRTVGGAISAVSCVALLGFAYGGRRSRARQRLEAEARTAASA